MNLRIFASTLLGLALGFASTGFAATGASIDQDPTAHLYGRAAIRADADRVSKTMSECMDNATSNLDSRECASEAFSSANDLVSDAYSLLVKELNEKAKAEVANGATGADGEYAEILRRLSASQQAWVTFRDATCDLRSSEMLGGTGEGLILIGCKSSLSIQRTHELLDFFGN